MTIFYSSSRNGFYPEDVLALMSESAVPTDLVEIESQLYAYCQEAPSRGEYVVPGEDGLPTTVALPGPSPEEAFAQNVRTRDQLLGWAALNMAPLSDAEDLGIATAAEAALLLQWRQYRIALGRINSAASDIVWPVPPSSSTDELQDKAREGAGNVDRGQLDWEEEPRSK